MANGETQKAYEKSPRGLEVHRKAAKAHYYRNQEAIKEKVRNRAREKVLAPEIYASMLSAQDGKCFICLRVSKSRLHVDHNHRTGAIRGLLCGLCNTRLGWFENHKTLIMDYVLERHGE